MNHLKNSKKYEVFCSKHGADSRCHQIVSSYFASLKNLHSTLLYYPYHILAKAQWRNGHLYVTANQSTYPLLEGDRILSFKTTRGTYFTLDVGVPPLTANGNLTEGVGVKPHHCITEQADKPIRETALRKVFLMLMRKEIDKKKQEILEKQFLKSARKVGRPR